MTTTKLLIILTLLTSTQASEDPTTPRIHHHNNNNNEPKTPPTQQESPIPTKDPYPHPRDELHYQHHQHPPPPPLEDDGDVTHHHATVNNDNEHHKQLYAKHHQHHQQPSATSRVLELSDRFLEIVNTMLPIGHQGSSSPSSPDSEEPKYQPWLVMFYAPWCGHCKRLEPVFNHVAQVLHNTPIRVGRVDCTRFPSVGSEYKINGYPTIMFISGPSRRHTFLGDRELTQIVRFANRMSSPPVTLSPVPLSKFLDKYLTTQITSPKLQNHPDNPARVKRRSSSKPKSNEYDAGDEDLDDDEDDYYEKSNNNVQYPPDLFFGILKPSLGYRDKLADAFKIVAGKYQQHNEFYEFVADDDSRVSESVVFVVKAGRVITFNFEYKSHGNNITRLLEHWVGNERFPDFIHLTRGNLYQVFSEGQGPFLKDLIVCAVVEEDRLERVMRGEEKRVLEVVQSVGRRSVDNTLLNKSPRLFDPISDVTGQGLPVIFSWIGSPDLANSIVAENLALPTLLIIHKSPSDHNHKYYVFSDYSAIDSEPEVENIIELVREGHFSPSAHANSLSFRVYRYAFDAKVSLVDMWVGNPVLTIVLFGLPLGFFSLIIYSACCGDIMDAKEEEDEEEYDESGGGGREDIEEEDEGEEDYDDTELLGGTRRRNHPKRE